MLPPWLVVDRPQFTSSRFSTDSSCGTARRNATNRGPVPLLDLEFEHSLSENDEFLVDDLPRDSDLESEDLVWEVKGLVIDPLTKLRHDDEEVLPREIVSGGANSLLSGGT